MCSSDLFGNSGIDARGDRGHKFSGDEGLPGLGIGSKSEPLAPGAADDVWLRRLPDQDGARILARRGPWAPMINLNGELILLKRRQHRRLPMFSGLRLLGDDSAWLRQGA